MATGSSALEQRAAAACAAISDLSVPLRDLWNPWTCPVKFLPYLAWAFSVDRWEEAWSETVKRQAVSDAFWIHQRKGTVAAVRRVIENMGYSMTLQEWWSVADPVGTFRLGIDVGETGMSEAVFNELERVIGDAKPVSRHISRLTVSVTTGGGVYTRLATTEADTLNVYPPDYMASGSATYDGGARYDGSMYHNP